MARPRSLLLDEPSLGIAPLLVQEILQKVTELNRDFGVTVLLVEQNARLAIKTSHRAYVVETGIFVQEGSADDLATGQRVKKHYLVA